MMLSERDEESKNSLVQICHLYAVVSGMFFIYHFSFII